MAAQRRAECGCLTKKLATRSKAPPRTRSAERTRERLVEAARSVFAKHGLAGASVGDIAQKAHVSAAMINHHFGGKLELYRFCLQGFGELRLQAIDKHLVVPQSQEEFRIRLEMLVNELFDLHVEHREVVNILLRDLDVADQWGKGIEKLLYEFTPRFSKFFELAQQQRFIRADIAPIAAASMIYLTLAGLLQADAHRTRVTGLGLTDPSHRALVVKMVIDVVLNGVVERGSGSQLAT